MPRARTFLVPGLLIYLEAHKQAIGEGLELAPGINLSPARIGLAGSLICGLIIIALVLRRTHSSARTKTRRSVLSYFSSAPAPSRRIKILESRRLSAHADICLCQVDGEEYLLALGPQKIVPLRQGFAATGASSIIDDEDPN